MNKFENICIYGNYGDVKQFHFDNELCEFIGSNDLSIFDEPITHNGVEYIPHWLFFNIIHQTDVYGVLYLPIDLKYDVLFGVVGCKYDTINNGIVSGFDAIYEMLTDELHYIDYRK